MRTFRRLSYLAATILAVALCQASASAEIGQFCGGGFPYPGWSGSFSSPYASGRIPTPPYFSLHPPVYYSYPVPRSYGYSPYAYPGSVRTPEVEVKKVAVIENPYAKKNKVKTTNNRTASVGNRSQLVLNPYARANATIETQTALAYSQD